MTSQGKSLRLLCVVLMGILPVLFGATSLAFEANDSVSVSQVFANRMEELSSISSFRYQDFKLEDLPEFWDWRTQGAVTNVKDQGLCTGSGWAFATAAAVEGLTPLYNKPYGRLMNLSVQNLVACSKPYGTRGCEGYLPIREAMTSIRGAMTYIRDHGLVTEEKLPCMFPYGQPTNSNCESLPPPDMKISGYEVVPEFDEVALVKAVYHQPVVVLHSISEKFRKHRRGIFMDADGECAKGNISHSSTIVGFGTTPFGQDYWIMKNSWGTHWGEHGYGLINRNSRSKQGTCNLATFPVFPTL